MPALHLNFVKRRHKTPAIAALVGAAGLVALVTVTVLWFQADGERQSLTEEQRRLLLAQKKKGISPTSKAVAVANAASGSKTSQVRSALEQPWSNVLDAIAVAARDASIGMVGIDAQGPSRTVFITAESKDLAGAFSWVQQLRGLRWIQSASLSGHELRNDNAVPHIRFTVELVWKAPR